MFKDNAAKLAVANYLNEFGDPLIDNPERASASDVARTAVQMFIYDMDDFGDDLYHDIGSIEVYTDDSVNAAKSVKCSTRRRRSVKAASARMKRKSMDDFFEDELRKRGDDEASCSARKAYHDAVKSNRFNVILSYRRDSGISDDEFFNDWSDVESFAHEGLMNGLYVSITDMETGKQLEISPDEYQDAFDGDFDINEDIVRFKRGIISSKSVQCSSRRRIRAAANSGVMLKTETAEGTYYLAKSATKKKTFWTESYDSANKFAKKDSALNKLYSVLGRLEDNAFYDADDMYDIESEADLKKAKFAKFYITDLSGKTIEDISTEVKNRLLADDEFVSAVLGDIDDEDDIEESTKVRGRRTIKASVGDDVYEDDIKDIIRNAGIKVWEVKKSRTHNSDSFFSILLDTTDDFNAVVDAITDAGYGVTYDYPAVDGNYMYIMISDNREDDAFLYKVVYGYQSEVVPMDDETSDYQAVLDECIDMKEARGDKDLYTIDEVESDGWYDDEYVTGGNHGLSLYTGGNFMIEPIGRGKLSEYVGSATKVCAARDNTVDETAVRKMVEAIVNDYELYPTAMSIIKNMQRKIKRGKYNADLAVNAWQYLADEGVAKYYKTKGALNPETRKAIAVGLRDNYEEEVNEGVEASEGLVTM